MRSIWKDFKVLSLHRKKREVAKATPLFDERWPWSNHHRPKILVEPDCIKLTDLCKIEKACDLWLSNRNLQTSWRRLF